MHASHVCAEGTIAEVSLNFFLSSFNFTVRSPAADMHSRVGLLHLPTNRRFIGTSPGSLVRLLKESWEEW